MDKKPSDSGAKPRTNRNNQRQKCGSQNHRVVRKVPPRGATDKRNIYITSKSDFKSQEKRCKDLLNSGTKEIFLHCMGYSITRGLNLALRLIENSNGVLSYAINTSTIHLVDELHPLCDKDDITFRERNNSALHIKIFNKSLFDIVVPQLPAQPTLQANNRRSEQQQQKQKKQPQEK